MGENTPEFMSSSDGESTPLLNTPPAFQAMFPSARRTSAAYGLESAMAGRRVSFKPVEWEGRLVSQKRLSIAGISPPEDLEDADDEGQTNPEAVFNLLNNCLGSGILTVSFAFTHVGLAGGCAGLVASAILNRLTLLLVVKCCDIVQCEVAVAALGRRLFGNPGRLLVVVSYTALCLGLVVVYTNACKSFLEQLVSVVWIYSNNFGPVPRHWVAAGVFVALVPATFLRSMKKVAMISIVNFVGVIIAVLAILTRTTSDIMKHHAVGTVNGIRLWPTSPAHIFAAMPLLVVVMSAQSGGPVIFASLTDPSNGNKRVIATIMYVIAFTLNICLATSVYLDYGDGARGNVLDSFDVFDPCAIIARIGMLIAVGLSYIFIVFPCRVAIIDILFNKNEVMHEASYPEFVFTTMLINVACQLIAYFVSDVAFVMGIVGAICSNMIGFIIPPLFYMQACTMPERSDLTPTPLLSLSNIGFWCLFCFGIASMILSVSSTING